MNAQPSWLHQALATAAVISTAAIKVVSQMTVFANLQHPSVVHKIFILGKERSNKRNVEGRSVI